MTMTTRRARDTFALLVALNMLGCPTKEPPPDDPAPTACQPLANGAGLADLAIDRDALRCSWRVETRSFATLSCENEGCVGGLGRRRLLRFDLGLRNLGDGDVTLTPSTATAPSDAAVTCRRRASEGLVTVEVLRGETVVAAGAGRRACCLEDTRRDDLRGAATARFSCAREGLQAHWASVCDAATPCQWVDVSALAPGAYRLRVRVNASRAVTEANLCNNEEVVDVTLPPEGVDDVRAVTQPCAPTTRDGCALSDNDGERRDCGWSADAVRTCAPGARVTVGCNAACAPAVGRCTGDTVLRVCAGEGPCFERDALAANDDACGSACSQASFVCPASGRYTVLTGAFLAGERAMCAVDVR
jgi:Lysyl oxidase